MLRLFFTTGHFERAGVPIAGIPMIVSDDMKFVEPACEWLLYISGRGRSSSPETWRTYGEAIYDWFSTVYINRWAWDAVDERHLRAYRDRMRSTSEGKVHLSRVTVNARLRIVRRFYMWALRRGYIAISPFPVEPQATASKRSHRYRPDPDSASLMLTQHRDGGPRGLSTQQLIRVADQLHSRDLLIFQWALHGGIRRMEAAGLSIRHLPIDSPESTLVSVHLDVTKGSKRRTISIPSTLLQRTWAYLNLEASSLRLDENSPVFAQRDGKRLSPASIGRMFVRAAKRANVSATFHDLRHTFAIRMLYTLMKLRPSAPEMNPLLALRNLLGHSSIATTEQYLRALEADVSFITEHDMEEFMPFASLYAAAS